MKQEISFSFETYASAEELPASLSSLIESSEKACKLAYAPYSKFNVGAAVLLANGEVLVGSNKENASFPAGTCAERNVLNYVRDHHPGVKIQAIAISAVPEEFELSGPLAPCGICRQVMAEVEFVQGSPIQVLMNSTEGKVLSVSAAKDLLPFHFYVPELKK